MSKKEIVNVNLANLKENKVAFEDGFLWAVSNGTLNVKGDKIYIETSDKIFAVNIKDFIFIWKQSFERMFSNEFRMILNINKVCPELLKILFDWTNPVFDKLPEKIEAKERFLKDFEEALKDEEYYIAVKAAMLIKISSLDEEQRRLYFDRFVPMGILNEEDKIKFEYYANETPENLAKIFEENNFTLEDRIEVVSQAFVEERSRQNMLERKNKKTNSNRIVKLVNLLPPMEILDVFISGVLTAEEFLKSKVTKNDLLHGSYEMLLEVLSDKNDLLPERLKITSMDLVNEYGRTLGGTEIFKLFEYGYIKHEDLIQVYEINKPLKILLPEEMLIGDEELKGVYTPSVLVQMYKDDKLSPRFMQTFLELENFEENSEIFHDKSQKLIECLKEENEEITDDVLKLFDIGLCDSETARQNVPESYIQEKFIEDGLTIEDVFRYYQKGLITEEEISNYYDNKELLELYKSGKIGGKALRIIRDTNLLLQEFCNGEIADEDYLDLYLQGSVPVSDLSDGLEVTEKEIDISSFITEKTDYDKIKELFTHYLIDYASILRLHNQEIINDEQLKEVKSLLSTREFFDELKLGKTYRVMTSRKGETTPRGRSFRGEAKEKDFSNEVALISEILGKDIENEQYSLIESYNVKGKPTSLNNYRIFGNEELDGIIILQKSKKENSVYVMSALQMMYFLHGKENDEGQIEIQNRMKDKAYLKTIEGVEVVEHTEYFARNLVEAAARISPKVSERLKKKDGKYVAEVDQMVQKMREQYLEDRAKGRND